LHNWERWAQENVDRVALNTPDPPRVYVPRVYHLDPRDCRCGTSFTPVRGNQVWCSATCRSRHLMQRKRDRDAVQCNPEGETDA